MKRPLAIASFVLFVLAVNAASQTVAPAQNTQPIYRSSDPIENISNDTARMARAVEALSRSWGEFTKTFSTNQGLQLEEKQKSLILALEVLNRLEASLANMQKLRFDLTERQTNATARIAQLNDDLLPESIDRWVSLRGTTNAETLRNERRQSLTRQLREWQNLLIQVTRELDSTLVDIRRTELQVKGLRDRVFAEAERQLADF
jgi:predicted  nucleic acid-binding Zn-ribbon protein